MKSAVPSSPWSISREPGRADLTRRVMASSPDVPRTNSVRSNTTGSGAVCAAPAGTAMPP